MKVCELWNTLKTIIIEINYNYIFILREYIQEIFSETNDLLRWEKNEQSGRTDWRNCYFRDTKDVLLLFWVLNFNHTVWTLLCIFIFSFESNFNLLQNDKHRIVQRLPVIPCTHSPTINILPQLLYLLSFSF